jgi:uncharacterized protein YqeY
MSLIQKIESQRLKARKSGNSVENEALTYLLSEAKTIGKNDGNRETEDHEVILLAKKLKQISEEIKTQVKDQDRIMEIEKEIEIYSRFIPEDVPEGDLKYVINSIIAEKNISSKNQIGIVMKSLKDMFGASLNGKMASEILKTILK